MNDAWRAYSSAVNKMTFEQLVERHDRSQLESVYKILSLGKSVPNCSNKVLALIIVAISRSNGLFLGDVLSEDSLRVYYEEVLGHFYGDDELLSQEVLDSVSRQDLVKMHSIVSKVYIPASYRKDTILRSIRDYFASMSRVSSMKRGLTP